MLKWCVKKCSVNASELVKFYGVRKPLAYALYNRKIRNRDEIKKYIDTENFVFQNIEDLSGVKKAFEIIRDALENNRKIYIYGDYDADGVMSTSIMYKGLYGLGADIHYFIPNRVEDGYGLNDKALEKLINDGAELIITCDNGITAIDQIRLAKEHGVKTIILDHHEPPFEETEEGKRDILPEADAVADAKMQNCGYEYTQMCAGGLCYRFICGLYKFLGRELKNENELCELAAVATICDVVDLTGENRAIASKGIEIINRGSNNLGLKSLIELKEIKSINSYTLGFVIGPCINASGRLDSAKIAVELFVTDSRIRAEELANRLNDFNEERKNITAVCLERISQSIENSEIINDKIIVAYDSETHESVAGIIAGRLREKYGRPSIVLTAAEGGAKGSGRSVESYDMFKALYSVKELMTKFGGHTMAAGLSIKEENIDLLRKKLNDNCSMSIEDMSPVLRMEAVLELEDISTESAEELNVLAPFGKANEKPLFGIKNTEIRDIRFIGKDKNIVSCFFDDGTRRVKVIDFDNYEIWEKYISDMGGSVEHCGGITAYADAVFTLDVNEYKGYRNPQLVIKDIRLK
ncbi:MAG: single-stranded-DNA-specific exonuclease RecJ [Clostridia bacterium]|nr:single-stranded-DNA-specific exonuclease RecJ [Clostridia bacterium]